MKKLLPLFALFLAISCAHAQPRQVDDYHWTGVERVVAIGDLHGDYENYLAALRAAGLVDQRGRWEGGATHLVQVGDIPDRGADSNRIMEHLDKLATAARRKGGEVHLLIGNHEAMNVYGDLRYVSPGEYEAFAGRNSGELRDRYFTLFMQNFEQRDPAGFAALPETFRAEWDKEHPLGWVEHRQAWDLRWNPEAKFAKRALGLKVAVKINDLLFVHGGISGKYCGNSLASLTELVIGRLRKFDPANTGPLEDDLGPLWYRGLSGRAPAASPETVQAILDHHGAKHILVGHTPTSGAIWPGYDGRVIQIDTGISSAYGGHVAYFEANAEGLFGGYPGGKLPLPKADAERAAYLEQVIALNPDNAALPQTLAQLQSPAPAAEAPVDEDGAAPAASAPAEAPAVPTCGTYQ